MICASSKNQQVNICDGDSGGNNIFIATVVFTSVVITIVVFTNVVFTTVNLMNIVFKTVVSQQ
jgi:hypothetical protein